MEHFQDDELKVQYSGDDESLAAMALEQLIHRHRNDLKVLARRLCGPKSIDEADELQCDTTLRLWMSRHTYRPSLTSWLNWACVVMANCASKRRRIQNRKIATKAGGNSLSQLTELAVGAFDSPDDVAIWNDLKNAIDAQISREDQILKENESQISPPSISEIERPEEHSSFAENQAKSKQPIGIAKHSSQNTEEQRRVIRKMRVGETHYLFRRRRHFQWKIENAMRHSGSIAEVPEIIGYGKSMRRAWISWKETFHVRFQELSAKRQFEMSADERQLWKRFNQIVDMPAYWAALPLRIRQIGTLEIEPSGKRRIAWNSGEQQHVSLGRMPAEFARYKSGDRFEAIVVYHSDTLEFQRVESIFPLATHIMTAARRQELWDSLPTSRDLPVGDWE